MTNTAIAPQTTFRTDAWRTMGVGVEDLKTGHDVLRKAGLLGWDVRKVPMRTEPILTPSGVYTLDVPGQYTVVRNNGDTPLVLGVGNEKRPTASVVGRDYVHFQNEDTTELLDNLVMASDGAANYSAAGAFNGGRDTFVTMKLGPTVQIGGADPVDQFVVLYNNHVGKKKLRLLVMAIRLICSNGLKAVTPIGDTFGVRHTENGLRADLEEARRLLTLSIKWSEVFKAEAEKMAAETLTQARFEEMITREFGASKEDSPSKRGFAQSKIGKLMDLFVVAGTNEGIRETRWAGYNALTEYYDHHSIVRSGDRSEVGVRSERVLSGAQDADKVRAWNMFLVQ